MNGPKMSRPVLVLKLRAIKTLKAIPKMSKVPNLTQNG